MYDTVRKEIATLVHCSLKGDELQAVQIYG